MTATSQAALDSAVRWLVEVSSEQPFGEVKVSVQIRSGNIVCIRKSIEETTQT